MSRTKFLRNFGFDYWSNPAGNLGDEFFKAWYAKSVQAWYEHQETKNAHDMKQPIPCDICECLVCESDLAKAFKDFWAKQNLVLLHRKYQKRYYSKPDVKARCAATRRAKDIKERDVRLLAAEQRKITHEESTIESMESVRGRPKKRREPVLCTAECFKMFEKTLEIEAVENLKRKMRKKEEAAYDKRLAEIEAQNQVWTFGTLNYEYNNAFWPWSGQESNGFGCRPFWQLLKELKTHA